MYLAKFTVNIVRSRWPSMIIALITAMVCASQVIVHPAHVCVCTPSRRSCPPAQREHTPSPSSNSFLLHVGNYSCPEPLVTRCHKRLLLPCLICGHDIIHYVFASVAVFLRTFGEQLQGLSDMPSAMKKIRKKFNKHRAASAVYSRLTPALCVAIFYLSCTGMSLTDVASTIVKLDGGADWRL